MPMGGSADDLTGSLMEIEGDLVSSLLDDSIEADRLSLRLVGM